MEITLQQFLKNCSHHSIWSDFVRSFPKRYQLFRVAEDFYWIIFKTRIIRCRLDDTLCPLSSPQRAQVQEIPFLDNKAGRIVKSWDNRYTMPSDISLQYELPFYDMHLTVIVNWYCRENWSRWWQWAECTRQSSLKVKFGKLKSLLGHTKEYFLKLYRRQFWNKENEGFSANTKNLKKRFIVQDNQKRPQLKQIYTVFDSF